MSHHHSWGEKWVEVSPTRFNGAYGYIQVNMKGKWEAVVVYNLRNKQRVWEKVRETVGVYRRPREAMMAVENKANELKALKELNFINHSNLVI